MKYSLINEVSTETNFKITPETDENYSLFYQPPKIFT